MVQSSPSSEQWFIFESGEVKGPYSYDDLMSLIRMGLLDDDAEVYCDRRGAAWMSCSEFLARFGRGPADAVTLELAPLPEDQDIAAPGPDSPFPSGSDPRAEAPLLSAASVPVRDRIVVLGRRRAGKTIYLAELYHQLWNSRDGLSMKALSGRSHVELMGVHETLRQGQWPQATQKDTVLKMEFELQYRGRSRILVGLDYAGEVFRDAFVHDDLSSPQARALVSHLDRALALILLIDPSVAVSGDSHAMIDDDFGIVQAVQRVRDWPGGEDVPVVLLLTKADQNRHLFSSREATRLFVETHYPALVRTLEKFKIFHVSAVQATRDAAGNLLPRPDSSPVNVVESLRYCLDRIEAAEERKQLRKDQQARQQAVERMLQEQATLERRSNRRLAALAAGIVTIGVCVMVLILIWRG